MPQFVDSEVLMRVLSRAHGITSNPEAAIGPVLEPHRQVEPADHLTVNLRLAGTCTDRRPAKQVIKIARRQGLQQFGGDRQPARQDIQHQPPRQVQPFGHVTAAIELRIVNQPLPPDGSSWFLDIGAHH